MKNVLVTGASYGLGEAIACELCKKECNVWNLSRSSPVNPLKEKWVQTDLSLSSSINISVKKLEAMGIVFDGVVHNAAIQNRISSQWNEEDVKEHFDINALAPMILTQYLQLYKLLAPSCSILVLSSISGELGHEDFVAYAMSKAALTAWAKSFHSRTKKSKLDYHLRIVYPGRVATPGNPKRDTTDWNPFQDPAVVAPKLVELLMLKTDTLDGNVIDLGKR